MPTPKTVVILQSAYVPWKGYFDLLSAADDFIIYDEVQFSKGDWRNRNRIITSGKLVWLTIPVKTSGLLLQAIDTVEASDLHWAEHHWRRIRESYRHTPFFDAVAPVLEATYRSLDGQANLSVINVKLLRVLAELMGLEPSLTDSRTVPRTTDDPTQRLVELCIARQATRYLSGPAAQSYLKSEPFRAAGIELRYADYGGYPAYPQPLEPFEHGVSILDMLFRIGPEASRSHLKSLRNPNGFIAFPETEKGGLIGSSAPSAIGVAGRSLLRCRDGDLA